MSTGFVRPARATDAEAAAGAQLAAWRADRRLPTHVLEGIDETALAQQWADAAVHPPSPRHRVLVAVHGPTGEGMVVGIAATAPAQDPDRDPQRDAELLALAVHPDHRREGHGSRLLQAAADTLVAADVSVACTWVESDDEAGRLFLTKAGWAADGAHRTLDLDGTGVVTATEVRLVTSLMNP